MKKENNRMMKIVSYLSLLTMSEVLNGTRPDLTGIEELCREEKIGGSKSVGIGFRG